MLTVLSFDSGILTPMAKLSATNPCKSIHLNDFLISREQNGVHIEDAQLRDHRERWLYRA